MTTEQPEMIILRDEAGAYYALPLPLLERARVPDDEQAAVAELADGDTAGFLGRGRFEAIGLLPPAGFAALPGVGRIAAQFGAVEGFSTAAFDERSF